MRRGVWSGAALALVGALAWSAGAEAQGVVYVQQQPQYQQQQYQYQQQPVQQQVEYIEDLPRFRFALTGGGGVGFGDATSLFVEGTLQAGVQLNDLLAIYYRGRGQIGAILSNNSGAVALYAALYNPVIVDVTLGDYFQIGAGPSFDYAIFETSVSRFESWGFGGDARIALTIPYYMGRQSQWSGVSRGGYTIELNFHIGALGFDYARPLFHSQVGIAAGWILY